MLFVSFFGNSWACNWKNNQIKIKRYTKKQLICEDENIFELFSWGTSNDGDNL